MIAKSVLKKCLFFFDEYNILLTEESILCSFSKSLTELIILPSDNNLLQNSIDLWFWCYKIAKQRENLNTESLKKFYKTNSDNCLLTKSLMILLKAHEVIGEAQICCKYEVVFFSFFHLYILLFKGKFLRFLLVEFNEALNNANVSDILRDNLYDYVLKNVAIEIYQCLTCIFRLFFNLKITFKFF